MESKADGRTDRQLDRPKGNKINKIDLKTALEQTDRPTDAKKRNQGEEKPEMHKINNLNIGIM